MKSKNENLFSKIIPWLILRHSRLRLVLSISLVVTGKVFAQAPPNITAFSPASGAPGSTVSITGTGFDATAANNIVYFTGVRATVTSASATSLIVTVPTGAAYGPIQVLNTGTGLIAYAAQPFVPTFNNPCFTALSAASFDTRLDYATGSSPYQIKTCDVDGDSRPDLVVTNQSSGTLSVMLNTSSSGSVSFAARVNAIAASGVRGIVMGDMDGDGKPDAVVNNSSGSISVFRNTSSSGTVSFATRADFAAGTNPTTIALSDIDGDGKLDVVVNYYDYKFISVFLNTSAGSGSVSFAARADFATFNSGGNDIAAVDVDGDGKTDVVITNELYNLVSVFRNTSAGSGSVSFATRIDIAASSAPRGVFAGDLDGDGKPDLAVANNTSGTLSVFRNTSSSGSVSFAGRADYTAGTNPQTMTIADVDGDSRPDLLVTNLNSNTLSVFRNTSTSSGSISLATRVDYSTGTRPNAAAVCDLNGDGQPDIAVSNLTSNTASVFKNIITPTSLSTIAGPNTTSNAVCDNGIWKTLYNSSGNTVMAAIKDNGQSLGASSATVYVDAQPGTLSDGEHYMARHFKISVTTQPSSAVQVRLYFTDAELQGLEAVDAGVQSIADLNVTKYSGSNEDGTLDFSGGTLVFIPKTSITTGQEFGANYMQFSVTGFSEFWIHGGDFALPVELMSFSAAKSGDGVVLHWTTAQEQNADRFIVERSSDGVTYAGIGSVAASGTTSQQHSYSYTDAAPLNGLSYYRLQQVDIDGHRDISKVLPVRWEKTASPAVVISYSGNRQVQVRIDGPVNNGRLEIYDAAGRQMKSYPVNIRGASAQLDLDLGAFSAGIYLYRLMTSDGRVSSGKIMLQ